MTEKNNSAEYRSNGYWWWRDPKTGDLHGPFTTRSLCRAARTKIRAEQTAAEEAAIVSANSGQLLKQAS